MDLIQSIQKLKSFLASAIAKEKFAEEAITLEDGTVITSNGVDLEVGVAVFAVDAEGNTTPLADGNYMMADKSSIVIVDGMVSEMVAAPVEEVDAKVEVEVEDVVDSMDTPEDPKEDTKYATAEEVAILSEKIDMLTNQLKELVDIVGSQVSMSAEIKKDVEKFSKLPGDLKVSTKRVATKANEDFIEEYKKSLQSKL